MANDRNAAVPSGRAPVIPAGITGAELPKAVLAELSTLPVAVASSLAKHLVAAGQLLDLDPEEAFAHAWIARQQAPRLACTREAAGLAAYAAGKYAEAMPELRAARRMTGTATLLPVIADVERALGRPERALEIAASDEVNRLDAEGRIEMRLVAAGARRDLGQLDAAVLTLQVPGVRSSSRLAYAYADALLAAGRREDAVTEFARAARLDTAGMTDADERLAELEGVVFVDVLDEEELEPSSDPMPKDSSATAVDTPPDSQSTASSGGEREDHVTPAPLREETKIGGNSPFASSGPVERTGASADLRADPGADPVSSDVEKMSGTVAPLFQPPSD